VVIDSEGLVLTIGYLILEADRVELSTADGRTFPAVVVGYDHATGFGLLRSLAALPIAPVQVGQSAKIAERERVLIVGFDGVAPASWPALPFAGYWEYLPTRRSTRCCHGERAPALLNREAPLKPLAARTTAGRGPGAGNLFVPSTPGRCWGSARGRSSAPPGPGSASAPRTFRHVIDQVYAGPGRSSGGPAR
jgi:hypothetical protein